MPRLASLLLTAAGLLVLSGTSAAQQAEEDPPRGLVQPDGVEQEEAQVLAVVEALFEAMAARDTDLLGEVLLPEGQLVVVREVDDGSVLTSVTSHRDFVAIVGGAAEPIIERFWQPEVLIHGPLAVVWTPYDLWGRSSRVEPTP